VLADEIRERKDGRSLFRLQENLALEKELLAFRAANSPSAGGSADSVPSHRWFHYTDVPIQDAHYADGNAGRSQWDVVHMTEYCIRVLEGAEPADNPRKITPSVALVLLAHYVGDLHQPLHVGAAYLNQNGELRYPGRDADALDDQGGNLIDFGASTLHAYWDVETVDSALSQERRLEGNDALTLVQWARKLAMQEPVKWKPDANVAPEKWIELWADEILPIAREAHDRLRIYPASQTTDRTGKLVFRWSAVAKPSVAGADPYDVWSGRAVREELQKAGWRLACLLQIVFEAKH